ncbi:unnamed protein product, partial [Ilex paraguariensis]
MQSNYVSRLGGAFRQGIQRSLVGEGRGLQYSVDGLIGQGKLLFGKSRLLQSVPLDDLHVFLRPGTLATAQSNLHLADRKKNLFVVAAVSRTFSIPSVSGPSFQVCGYHVDCLLSEPNHSLGIGSQKSLMAVCGSRATLSDSSLSCLTSRHGHLRVSTNTSVTCCKYNFFDSCSKARMSLSNKEQPNNFLVYGYFIYNVAKSRRWSNPYLGFGFKGLPISSPAYFSAGTARDVSFDNSAREEQTASSADSSDQKILADRTLKLHSGSCYLPHPDKEETGGEDAHFICADEQAIGVADGVGGWADLGVNAGIYARELMSNSVTAIQEEPKGSIDPARVLEKSHSITKAKGSSTACIIALTGQGLHAINLGDSGFMVVRDGCTIFRSPVQQHDFNFTFQLESGDGGDLPSSGQ